MKAKLCAAALCSLLLTGLWTQEAKAKAAPERNPAQQAVQASPQTSAPPSDDTQQLRADLQRMKVLLNQMRTNLAFVQTSQTPLKHQFELETDAWQLLVEQMERRLERIEKTREQAPKQ